LGGAFITAGGLFGTAARFFYTNDRGWGFFTASLGVLALVVQGFKARAAYLEQVRKDSIHELEGCLHTLETVLLGADIEPAKRAAAGLRLTIYIPDGSGKLEQAMDYVGDQRTSNAAGRKIPENVGVAGQAFRHAQLHPDDPKLFQGARVGPDQAAFIAQMVADYSFSAADARKLNAETQSWIGFAIVGNGKIHGVLYCDSKQADFFTLSRRNDVLHGVVGIAYFVGLRYSWWWFTMAEMKEVVISGPGSAIRISSTDVPDYLRKAISASAERGTKDAQILIKRSLPEKVAQE
jgi:hypothetical protein